MHSSTELGRAAALGGLIVGALALGAPSADASVIHACLNKRSGAVRIVGANAKCRHGERKQSWNATGPAGRGGAPGSAGSPGTAGTNGSNGVGADFATNNFGPTVLTEGEPGVIVAAKAIPAGSYFASAKTVIAAGKGTGAVFVEVLCELVDTPGTPSLVEPPAALDLAEWLQQLSKFGSEWEGASTLAMQGPLTTTEPTTLALICEALSGPKEAAVFAAGSDVSALQTTANK